MFMSKLLCLTRVNFKSLRYNGNNAFSSLFPKPYLKEQVKNMQNEHAQFQATVN